MPDTRQRQKEEGKKRAGGERKRGKEQKKGKPKRGKWAEMVCIVRYHGLGIGKEVGGDDQ